MNIVISGSSGFVGNAMKKHFEINNHKIIPITKDDFAANNNRLIQNKLEGRDVIINLSGATIAKYWSESYKKEIYDSRISSTKAIVNALKTVSKPPKLFVSTSAIGYYPSDRIYYEHDNKQGDSFLSNLCHDWESEANQASDTTRVVIARFGTVLGSDGGILQQLEPLFRYGLGAKIGDGSQYFSWIHVEDLVRAVDYFINNESASGIYNLTSADITTNEHFSELLAESLGTKLRFSIPKSLFRIRYGEGEEFITDGQGAYPERLTKEGFEYKFPLLSSALSDIYAKQQ